MNVLSVQAFTVKRAGTTVLEDLCFAVARQKPMAFVGPSGSGKTTLLEALAGRLFYTGKLEKRANTQIAYVPQQHHYLNLSHTDTFYYQQRFNSFDSEDAALVADAVPQLFAAPDTGGNEQLELVQQLFNLDALKQRRILQLSNGEHKRLQLAKALLSAPDLLLLDAPFTGLDAANRALLEAGLQELCIKGVAVVLTCSESRIPAFVQEVLLLNNNGKGKVFAVDQFRLSLADRVLPQFDALLLSTLMPHTDQHQFVHAVNMIDVHVRYGDKTVLGNISWKVLRGERWSLSGPNGAGKSTLLTLITADNPQAYANKIFLFDRRRGSGESIWDIKKNIGFVSPELHLHFDKTATVVDAIASGFFDTIGLFRKINNEQAEKVAGWIKLLQLSAVANRMLWQQPLGTQRLVLLARAMVKSPPLLVLDEPLQGLDEAQAAIIKGIIDLICSQTTQTVLFVSHHTDDLPASVTHYLCLENGRVASLS